MLRGLGGAGMPLSTLQFLECPGEYEGSMLFTEASQWYH